MRLDRPDGDSQLVRDALVASAIGKEREDLLLARGQRIGVEPGDEPGRDRARDVVVAQEDAPRGRQQFIRLDGEKPAPLVAQDLEKCHLARLELPDVKGGAYRFFGIYRTDTPPGPAGAFLLARLEQQASG